MPARPSPSARANARPAIWRIVTWVLLFLAIFGVFQYCTHAWRVVAMLRQAEGSAGHAPLARMLAWDIAYLVVACITVTASAGVLLRRGWARPVLRVVAGLLALWLLATAIMLMAHWSSFSNHSSQLLAQSGLGDAGRQWLRHLRRNYLVAMILKAVAVPVLAWLVWRLGVPAVRAQFPAQRKP